VCARIVEGEERAACWRAANSEYGGFDHYDAATARDINVFVLE
jgi:F420H(2)-dependent quinone reductase